MKPEVKIHFSQLELECMHDEQFLLTKRKVTQKIYELLYGVAEQIKKTSVHQNFSFSKGTDADRGKISRGENYKGLPYIILDFPKLFEKENVFAFRTMFWWSKYFSCTLHLRGQPLEQQRQQILKNLPRLQDDLHFSITNEWEHDISDAAFLVVKNDEQTRAAIAEAELLKLSKKIPLQEYEKLPQMAAEIYAKCLGF